MLSLSGKNSQPILFTYPFQSSAYNLLLAIFEIFAEQEVS